mgnify:FL=1
MSLLKWSVGASIIALAALLLSIAYGWPFSVVATTFIGLVAGMALAWIGLIVAIFLEA